MTATRVTAMAGTERRTSSPAVTPMTRARTVIPTGTTPRAPNSTGHSRGTLSRPGSE